MLNEDRLGITHVWLYLSHVGQWRSKRSRISTDMNGLLLLRGPLILCQKMPF